MDLDGWIWMDGLGWIGWDGWVGMDGFGWMGWTDGLGDKSSGLDWRWGKANCMKLTVIVNVLPKGGSWTLAE